jgi:hypothetical protein
VLNISICLFSIEAKFCALGVHVRFAERERINVRLVLQVRQGVVDKSVCAFVGTNGINHIQQCRIRFETPVIFGYLWGGMMGPLWESALFDIFDAFLPFTISGEYDHRLGVDGTNRVGEHCFFFKVSHKL